MVVLQGEQWGRAEKDPQLVVGDPQLVQREKQVPFQGLFQRAIPTYDS